MLDKGEMKVREKAQLSDVGMYIRQISLDYRIESDKQLAQLISESFNVECHAIDIQNYERLHVLEEEYLLKNEKLWD